MDYMTGKDYKIPDAAGERGVLSCSERVFGGKTLRGLNLILFGLRIFWIKRGGEGAVFCCIANIIIIIL